MLELILIIVIYIGGLDYFKQREEAQTGKPSSYNKHIAYPITFLCCGVKKIVGLFSSWGENN
jgi:hypothetical protein